MKKYNISVPSEYDSGGEKKTAWKTVGTLVEWPATDDGKPERKIVELYMFPTTKFICFEQKPKEERTNSDW